MKKLILCSMLAVGFANADKQYTWKMAQEFNYSVLSRITWGGIRACDITSVRETSFVVRCMNIGIIINLPYNWRSWQIVQSGYDVVVYSNEY